MRKQVPPEKTKDVLAFATKKPHERLQSIRAALGVLSYGQSEYVRVSSSTLVQRGSVLDNRILRTAIRHACQSERGRAGPPGAGPGSTDPHVWSSEPSANYRELSPCSATVSSPSLTISPKQPRDGQWNMVDKKFYRPVTINRWVVVVYEREQRFNRDTAYDMVRNFLEQFAAVGTCMRVLRQSPSLTTTGRD